MIEIGLKTERKFQLLEITVAIEKEISKNHWKDGVCCVFCPHTTAGLCINENADPDVRHDLERAYAAAVPDVRFEHGEGNSPAHFLSTFLGPSLTVFVQDGKLRLGQWQGIYFGEMDGPRSRTVWVKFLGE